MEPRVGDAILRQGCVEFRRWAVGGQGRAAKAGTGRKARLQNPTVEGLGVRGLGHPDSLREME